MGETFVITSSWWASTGLVVCAIFLGIFFIITLGFIILAYKRLVLGWTRRQGIFQASILSCFFLIIATSLVPYFFEFTTLTITPANTWILKNGLGIPLKIILPDEPRAVTYGTEHVTWYGRAYESYNQSRLYIVTDKKIYPSDADINQEKIRAMYKDLDTLLFSRHYPRSENDTKPFSIYERLQYIHYGLWGLVCVVMLSPLVLFKKKK